MDDDWETMADDLSAFKLESDNNENEGEKRWDDEFEGGWEATAEWDSSSNAVPPPQPKNEAKASSVAAPKVLTKGQKKKQLQEALQRKKEEEERRAKISIEEQKKQREEDLQRSKMSDYENTLHLFGVDENPKADSLVEKKKDPKTTAEFIEFATATSSDVKRFSGSQEYLTCVKELVRQTCDVDDLSVEDVRAVIQTLNTLVNKKLKEEKGKKGKGKGKAGSKVNVRGGSGGEFDDHKAGEFDDYLDFM